MGKQLQVIAGPDEGRVFALPESDTLLLGRSRALEARLIDPYVSRVHCQIQVEGDRVLLSDFGSGSGLFVNMARSPEETRQGASQHALGRYGPPRNVRRPGAGLAGVQEVISAGNSGGRHTKGIGADQPGQKGQ
jgi:hypothetical protein